MVNFNQDSTVALDKKDINVIILIENHYFIIESLELYLKQKYQKTIPNATPALMARIDTLYNLLKPSIKFYWKKEKSRIEILAEQIKGNDLDNKLLAFDTMQTFMFNKGILRFSKHKTIDTGNTEDEDASKGL